ncbi:MAG: amidohydrolase [Bacteroidetes bacterium]|nr:amidohydrolase [Bacteroidota bacterium]MBL6944872.1 amidohydrolase [Bacteroidales bacterium]
MNKSEVKEKVSDIIDYLIFIRRHLHSNPEMSFNEKKTSLYISGLLTEWQIPHQTGIGGYGIVGLIKGKNPESKVIALRAEMDALAISEQNIVDYRSLNEGVMHACGHDVHMTCLLGTIKVLSDNKDAFEGTVKFIFQPAEENLPGGAIKMIKEGVLENPKPEMIFAQHVFPDLEVGKVGVKAGVYMASSDEINLYVKGKGGHAAIPGSFDNTILAASSIIVALQAINSTLSPPDVLTVLSFGKVIAEGTHNVIPSEVIVRGTFRTFDETWRKKAHELIKKIASNNASIYNTHCEVIIDKGYPVLKNDDKATMLFKESAVDFVGKENVKNLNIRTTVEDFARYTQLIPGCFYRLGTANKEKGITSNLHSPTFDVDEHSIEIGTGLMIWTTIRVLNSS